MVHVIATLTVDPARKAEIVAAAQPAILATRQEEGCLAYDLHESVTDPTKLVFVEEWDSADRLAPHGKTDHMRAFGRVAVLGFTAPPQVQIVTAA